VYALWWTDEGGFGPRLRWKGGAAVTQLGPLADSNQTRQRQAVSMPEQGHPRKPAVLRTGRVTLREWPELRSRTSSGLDGGGERELPTLAFRSRGAPSFFR
jgi:hypothetical protein